MKHWGLYLNHPAVLRLANISQFGALALINPKAGRSRLAHSVGVAVLASRVTTRLGLDYETGRQFQLAALVHDTGHGALSHLYDTVTTEAHEARTVAVIQTLKLSVADREAVIAFVLGTHPLPLLVANETGVDIDRIEYLRADCIALGLPEPFTEDEAVDAFSLRNGVFRIDDAFAAKLRHVRTNMFHRVYRTGAVHNIEAKIMPVFAPLVTKFGMNLTERLVLQFLTEAGITQSTG
jgi:HD superfamily phosphohydrolase